MSRKRQIEVIAAQPDWYVVYRREDGTGPVERAGIIGWQVSTKIKRRGQSVSFAKPITASPGDWCGATALYEHLRSAELEWETVHLPNGHRHMWEIELATRKPSNPTPGIVRDLTLFKP